MASRESLIAKTGQLNFGKLQSSTKGYLAGSIACCWISPDESVDCVTQYSCGNLNFCISLAVLKPIITTSYSAGYTQTVHVAHDNLRYCTRIFKQTALLIRTLVSLHYALYLKITFVSTDMGNGISHYHLNMIHFRYSLLYTIKCYSLITKF